MNEHDDKCGGDDWQSEAARGQQIRQITSSESAYLYPRLQWWELDRLTDFEKAQLNESRATREILHRIALQLEHFNATHSISLQIKEHATEPVPCVQKTIPTPPPPFDTGMIQRETKTHKILKMIESRGVYGATDSEGAKATGIEVYHYRSLRNSLKKQGLIVKTQSSRVADTGSLQSVWIKKTHTAHSYHEQIQSDGRKASISGVTA